MEKITSFLKDFDLVAILPKISTFAATTKWILWLLIMLAPILLLVLGALYYYKPPQEANFAWGFRTYFGMGSVEAWRYTQKIAGITWMLLGGALTVLMGIVGLFFIGIDAGKAAVAAIWCVSIQLVLVAASWVYINVRVLKVFDKDGDPRDKIKQILAQRQQEEQKTK